MKSNKIILAVLILSMIALIFSGCGGGNPVIPPIEDEEQEYVVEEKSFNVDAAQGGTFSLSDGTELKIDPGDLSDDAYVVLKRIRYDDLDFSKTWWADENPYVWIVDIIDCDNLLGNVELYMVASQFEYIGGEISGGIVRLKDGAFELVNEFTASVGEKVLVSIEEMGETAYLFVTNPINDAMIMNDLVEDIGLAVQYYYDGNCTSLYNLYQQALQEESTAENDLKNHPGVTKEDAQEIFDKVFSLKSVIDFAVGLIPVKSAKGVVVGTAFFSYKIYSAVVGIGEICKYTNAYMIAKNKADIYSSKIFKRRVIKYLYEQGCIENEGGEDCFLGYWINEDPNTPSITKIDIQKNNNLLEIYMWGKCHPTDCDWAAGNNPEGPATTTVDDADDGVLNIIWYPDFAIKTQEITYLGGDRLEVYTFTDFYPDDIYGREDYERYDYFIKND